jgi:hypothetical protein
MASDDVNTPSAGSRIEHEENVITPVRYFLDMDRRSSCAGNKGCREMMSMQRNGRTMPTIDGWLRSRTMKNGEDSLCLRYPSRIREEAWQNDRIFLREQKKPKFQITSAMNIVPKA